MFTPEIIWVGGRQVDEAHALRSTYIFIFIFSFCWSYILFLNTIAYLYAPD